MVKTSFLSRENVFMPKHGPNLSGTSKGRRRGSKDPKTDSQGTTKPGASNDLLLPRSISMFHSTAKAGGFNAPLVIIFSSFSLVQVQSLY